jgi:hypothetical protein
VTVVGAADGLPIATADGRPPTAAAETTDDGPQPTATPTPAAVVGRPSAVAPTPTATPPPTRTPPPLPTALPTVPPP